MTVIDAPPPTALFHVVALEPAANSCVRATLTPAHGEHRPTVGLFCDATDIDRLKTAAERLGPVAISGTLSSTHTLPVTIGLNVSFFGRTSEGDWQFLAFPRPAPVVLPADADSLHREIQQAIDSKSAVAFALSGAFKIVDAAVIDRDVALSMLGMRPAEQPVRR